MVCRLRPVLFGLDFFTVAEKHARIKNSYWSSPKHLRGFREKAPRLEFNLRLAVVLIA